MTTNEANVFDEIAGDDDVLDSVESPIAESSQNSEQNGGVYDWNQLSDSVKYERENLDGQVVTIKKADILRPHPKSEVIKAKNSNTHYIKVPLLITYDTPNEDREYYSGPKVFKQKDGTNSLPSVRAVGQSKTSELMRLYATYKNIDPEKVSLREFMAFLNSKPKVRIKHEQVGYDGKVYPKNLIAEFVKSE